MLYFLYSITFYVPTFIYMIPLCQMSSSTSSVVAIDVAKQCPAYRRNVHKCALWALHPPLENASWTTASSIHESRYVVNAHKALAPKNLNWFLEALHKLHHNVQTNCTMAAVNEPDESAHQQYSNNFIHPSCRITILIKKSIISYVDGHSSWRWWWWCVVSRLLCRCR